MRKYGLPTSHPAFQNALPADVLLEFFEDAWEEKHALEEAREKRGSHFGEYDRRRLSELEKLLGLTNGETSEDALADKWDREIAEGKIPNLDEMPP